MILRDKIAIKLNSPNTLNYDVCKQCCKKFLRRMVMADIPPQANRCKHLQWLMTEIFERAWKNGNSPCPVNVEPNPVGYTGITLLTDPIPKWCPFPDKHNKMDAYQEATKIDKQIEKLLQLHPITKEDRKQRL